MSAEKSKQAHSSQLKEWFGVFTQSAISLPMVVFTVLAIAVLAASTLYQENLQRSMHESVDRLSQESQLKTTARLEAYALFTRSGMGLLRAGGIDNEGWNAHLGAMGLDEDYPSVRMLGYSRVSQIGESGDVTLSPLYIYPQTSATRSMLGVEIDDLDDDMQEAIVQAARTGQMSLSEARLVADDEAGGYDYRLYIFMPVYQANSSPRTESERLASLQGSIFITIDTSTLFGQVYDDYDPAIVNLTVSQIIGGEKVELFGRSSGGQSSGPLISETRTLDIMGQHFVYEYDFSRAGLVPASQRYVAVAMPFFGLIVSLLLAMVISFTLRARNQRLFIAREREVQAAKDELLSLASHQLRTPATGVKQYLGMVIQGFAGKISDTQRDFLERAYSSNERQLHIINDILYLAKLDAGRIVLTKTRFDLAELVRSTAEEMQETAREAELTIDINTPKKAAVLADEHMLRMVIENLISNAIKYTAPGGEITVRLIRAGDSYSVSVTDTGVGIAREDIPKLFKQFTRIPNERSSEVSGTGVGLYLAYSLTEMHGGDITVESKPGQGSVFTITVPRGL